MKRKIESVLMLFLVAFSLHADEIWLYFKNNTQVHLTADSYWTFYYRAHNYSCYLAKCSDDDKRIPNSEYLCMYDYCCMNPAARETKRGDFKKLYNAILNTGNEANYFEDNGVTTDDWCVSIRYDQLDSAFRTLDSKKACFYRNGQKL